MGTITEGLILIKLLLCLLVEYGQIFNRGRVILKIGRNVLQMSNQHAKLSAPITHVVNTKYFMTTELEDTR